jgi:RimJ/RimL family protein N-acetyltransferase
VNLNVTESLKDLEFKDFREISNFEDKLSTFLSELGEELFYWRGYEKFNGCRRIMYPVMGHACLDGEKIVAINYFIVPRILSPRWLYDKVFRRRGFEVGVVVKKEYQRRGIADHMNSLRPKLLEELGVEEYWFRVDKDNVASMRLSEKHTDEMKGKIWKKTKDQVYFIINVNKDLRQKTD